MKILHTSDWHLGKYIGKYSRLSEQRQFIDELYSIAERENIDLIVISGDIFDTVNPPVPAERLFYEAMSLLTNGGKRPIVIISGNHDSPQKLSASVPLTMEFGVIIIDTPITIIPCGKYGDCEVVLSGEGFLRLKLNEEMLNISAVPFPTEKNINMIISEELGEAAYQRDFSLKIRELLDMRCRHFSPEINNIIIAHFFVRGGVEASSERKIQGVGGSYAVDKLAFPNSADYVAMGHLHIPQRLGERIYYSGAPMQYAKGEKTGKSVNIVELNKKNCSVYKIQLTNYKPIKTFACKSIDEAVEKCISEEEPAWIFIDIIDEQPINAVDLKKLYEIQNDIVEINVVYNETAESEADYDFEDKTIEEQFTDFYYSKYSAQPPQELTELFLELAGETDMTDFMQQNNISILGGDISEA